MRRDATTLCWGVSALLVLMAGTGLADDAETATLRQAAERGNPVAQLRLAWLIDPGLTTLSAVGSLYLRGNGVAQNACESARWYHRAAARGDRLAQFSLAELYETAGALQDYTVAAWWYRRAAEQGSESAQLRLGQLYRDGKGVPQDYVAAYQWIHLAAIHDCDGTEYSPAPGFTILCVARPERDRLEELMTSEQIEEARRAARDWHETHQRSPGEWYTANRDSPVWQSLPCQPATEVASADS